MRLVCTIHLREDAESEDDEAAGDSDANARRVWRWYVRPQFADDDGSRMATKPQTLPFHLESAEHFAREIVTRLGLQEPEMSAVVWAARFHDLGKTRALWQHSIGNRDPGKVLAKSGGKGSRETTGYRHEFGSLFDVEKEPEFIKLPADAQDLARHIIATHHGRARPHFSAQEAFDPNHTDNASARIAREVPRRFARLQRKYGRWGLAYLESLVRAADALASQIIETGEHHAPLDQAVVD
jgi:CRISPR-associated endonuclease/helicase Cas3